MSTEESKSTETPPQIELLVATFEGDDQAAFEYLKLFTDVSYPDRLGIEAATAAAKNEKGNIHTKHFGEKKSHGTAYGVITGAILGLFLGPAALIVGALAGGFIGKKLSHKHNVKISKKMEKHIEEGLKEGNSIMIVYVDKEGTEKMVYELENVGAKVVHEPFEQAVEEADASS